MTLHFTTTSGAHYEIDGDRVRRIEGSDGNAKRRDGDWITLHAIYPPEPIIGLPVELTLESLSAHGPDDYGHEHSPGPTTRTTTPVQYVWHAP